MATKVKRSKRVWDSVYDSADLTISSKRQITIPAAIARAIGLLPGDKLVARLEDGAIILEHRPKDLIELLDSFPPNVYGRTKEEIDAYIAEGRADRELPWPEASESTPK
jgi:AbrB family looped-hinge helix DNA binding protein